MDRAGGHASVRVQGVFGKSLDLPLSFAKNLKLLRKKDRL